MNSESLAIAVYQSRNFGLRNRETLRQTYADCFDEDISEEFLSESLGRWAEQGFVNPDDLSLSGTGRKRFQKLNQDFYFEIGLGRASLSLSERVFCNRVNKGIGLTQSITDWEELNRVIAELRSSRANRVVDLGCGLGTITRKIALELAKDVVGIDRSEVAIREAKRGCTLRNLRFEVATIEGYVDGMEQGSSCVAVDSLYFVDDIGSVIRRLSGKGIEWFVFMSDYALEDAAILDTAGSSSFGKNLESAGIPYRYVDFSENERVLWRERAEVIGELREMYRNEGNYYLWLDRYNEITYINGHCARGRNRRFLFMF